MKILLISRHLSEEKWNNAYLIFGSETTASTEQGEVSCGRCYSDSIAWVRYANPMEPSTRKLVHRISRGRHWGRVNRIYEIVISYYFRIHAITATVQHRGLFYFMIQYLRRSYPHLPGVVGFYKIKIMIFLTSSENLKAT